MVKNKTSSIGVRKRGKQLSYDELVDYIEELRAALGAAVVYDQMIRYRLAYGKNAKVSTEMVNQAYDEFTAKTKNALRLDESGWNNFVDSPPVSIAGFDENG